MLVERYPKAARFFFLSAVWNKRFGRSKCKCYVSLWHHFILTEMLAMECDTCWQMLNDAPVSSSTQTGLCCVTADWGFQVSIVGVGFPFTLYTSGGSRPWQQFTVPFSSLGALTSLTLLDDLAIKAQISFCGITSPSLCLSFIIKISFHALCFYNQKQHLRAAF